MVLGQSTIWDLREDSRVFFIPTVDYFFACVKQAFIPSDHIPSLSHRKDPVDNYELKDLLRAVLLDIHPKEERIVLSISQKDMLENGPKVSLGLVTHEELPKYHRQTLRNPPKAGEDLTTYIQKQREFENPGFLDMMRGHLEIPTSTTSERWHSLLPGYCGKLILPEDRADQLTMAQSCRWSMKSVEDGVKRMKEGDYAAALEAFNKAVEMNKKNIEALVARGALFVKKEDYNRAIKDFEEALSMNRSHRNARKYLADTFYALGKRFESGEPERALTHYKEALRLDPNFTEAVEAEERLRLGDQDVIEIPIASAKEPEKPKFSTAEKLRRMLSDSSADKDKPSSKRPKRSHSRDDRSSERSRSRRRTPSSERSRKNRSTSGRCVSRSERRSPKRSYVSPVRSKVPQNSNGKCSAPKQEEVRLEKKVERMPTPKVAIDVDEVAAQLEAFRAAKKAQALATNKDIQKKTFR
ncbi:hypothetical protein RvY_02576 [Ramazzottius varieornatus]|uniref:Uncharacterized protein n=1 Tax=Ramazzottius varieornatus TaxID=947166 RepID=A0A1D1UNK4_RAMVA|nr:hypothetical protein RvY_02576 [Ramazzottius varieornatus]